MVFGGSDGFGEGVAGFEAGLKRGAEGAAWLSAKRLRFSDSRWSAVTRSLDFGEGGLAGGDGLVPDEEGGAAAGVDGVGDEALGASPRA